MSAAWTEWAGGEQPVPDGTMVDVIFRADAMGMTSPTNRPIAAEMLRWEHSMGDHGAEGWGDIVSYKVVE